MDPLYRAAQKRVPIYYKSHRVEQGYLTMLYSVCLDIDRYSFLGHPVHDHGTIINNDHNDNNNETIIIVYYRSIEKTQKFRFRSGPVRLTGIFVQIRFRSGPVSKTRSGRLIGGSR